MRIAPPVRLDGRCLVCRGRRPRDRALEKLKPLYRAAMIDDPFCSTDCARTWYGTELGSATSISGSSAVGSRR